MSPARPPRRLATVLGPQGGKEVSESEGMRSLGFGIGGMVIDGRRCP